MMSLSNYCLYLILCSWQWAILRAKDSNISTWLSMLPLVRSQFDLSAQEFRDSLALRYKKPQLSLPSVCDGCRAQFSFEHSLDCCFGGLVSGICALLRVRRSANTCRLVRIAMPHLLLSVFLWIACLVLKQKFL